jgi:hypothetical protein
MVVNSQFCAQGLSLSTKLSSLANTGKRAVAWFSRERDRQESDRFAIIKPPPSTLYGQKRGKSSKVFPEKTSNQSERSVEK